MFNTHIVSFTIIDLEFLLYPLHSHWLLYMGTKEYRGYAWNNPESIIAIWIGFILFTGKVSIVNCINTLDSSQPYHDHDPLQCIQEAGSAQYLEYYKKHIVNTKYKSLVINSSFLNINWFGLCWH